MDSLPQALSRDAPATAPAGPEPGTGTRLRGLAATLWRTQPLACVGAVLLLGFVIAALFAPLLAPQDPARLDLGRRLLGPGAGHLFGTDELGRDILSRLLYGARLSMLVGVSVVAL